MAPSFGARNVAQMRRVAADGFVWGLPLVLSDLVARAHPLNGRFYELPANARNLAPGLVATHGDMWSCSAILDLASGPALISLPSAHGAYLSLMLHDGWGRALACLGPHEHRLDRHVVAVVGPSWRGDIPAGATQVRAPGDWVWAVCHVLGAGEGGREDALRLRESILLRSQDGVGAAADAGRLDLAAQHSFDDVLETMAPATFFWRLARLLASHPPDAPDDAAMVTALRRIGVVGQRFSFRDWPSEQVRAMEEGFEEGLRRVRWATPPANGFGGRAGDWTLAPAAAGPRCSGLERAAAVAGGLGAPPSDKVLAFTTTTDAAGAPLSGECAYRLTFEAGAAPSAADFWSVCLIDQRGAPLEAPFARLSVGDWFGLTPSPGEPFEISIQLGGDPGAGHRLRPPPGPFGLRLELYHPRRSARYPRWRPPAVTDAGLCGAPVNVSFAASRFAAAAAQPPRAASGPAIVHYLPQGA